MNVKIQKEEKSKIVLEFTMSTEEFEKELDKAFAKNAKHFKVPGFRNGKVPRNMVEKVYGEEVLYETIIDDTVNDEFVKVVEEQKFEVVSRPELDVKQIGKDKESIFTVAFFVKPEATVKKYKGLEIEKIDSKVSKEDLEAAIEAAREKNAKVVTIEDRALENGDTSTINFEGFVDGVAFEGGKGENFELVIGSGQFIPGFEEQLVGMTIGEDRDINVKFPEEYHSEALAGKDSVFKVKLLAIKGKVLPELDDEFAKDVSEFTTLEEYKKDLEEKTKKEKEVQAKITKETKVIEQLVENTEVEIPASMIDDQIAQMTEQFGANLAGQGLDLEKYCQYVGTTVESFKAELEPQAIKDIKLKLALECVAKSEKIEISEADIDEKIKELSAQYGQNDATDLLKNENARNYMKERLLQDKIMDLIIDSAIEKK